eukprot:CAMPEP_0198344772 /NCGR_PEP_ID=MMETSP1450-20131203/69600_1 /TAXON_ID=753684 ORGANISM="Madagascaria erythrocladiodes, Strain CCMP3234" /NCGR_SAMPLE_ID=MMETSP1450 /ASSEMBLY_ACC=CAM_ASM_001115 /LENGTH=112 /DNA_ID=CAMNT_0044050055 /DNA_START=153 /DNA_END=488 /DNA_ORIENTATION=+
MTHVVDPLHLAVKLSTRQVERWSVADVRYYLRAIGIDEAAVARLADEDVDGDGLVELTSADLREFGLRVGERRRLLRDVRALLDAPDRALERERVIVAQFRSHDDDDDDDDD